MSQSDLLDIVRESGAFVSDEEAERTIEATLQALSASLSAGECRDLAERLPERHASSVLEHESGEATPLDLDAFVERVRDDAEINHPRTKIRAVLAGLTTVVGEDEIENARAQLPPEYGRLFEPASIEPGTTFVDVVAAEGDFDQETAERATQETLAVLGHRLTEGEATAIAPYLRGDASDWLSQPATHEAEDISSERFVGRVAERADVPKDRARSFTSAVGDALVDVVPAEERERAEAQLPDQYASVLNLDG